jgi:cytochrome P450
MSEKHGLLYVKAISSVADFHHRYTSTSATERAVIPNPPSTTVSGTIMLAVIANIRPLVLCIWLFGSWILWYTLVVVQRLFFHPLVKVPGPKIAAATLLYQTWYCFVGGSRFYIKIEKLHEQYGPVVRIGPNEVHLSDPDNYDKINRVGTKFSKDGAFYGAFGNPNSSFTTASNQLHRLRRGGLNSFFSRKVVLQLEDIVHEKTELLAALVNEAFEKGGEVDIHHGLRAVSIDVVTDYAFGACYNLLKESDLGLKFFTLVHKIGPAAWIFRQWPWLKALAMAIPEPIIKVISEPIGQVRDMQNHCHDQLLEVKENRDAGMVKDDSRPTIFSALMDPQEGFSKGAVDNLEDEAYTVITAAADTTGNAMTTITRYVVENPAIYRRLHTELCDAFPDPCAEPSYAALEKLPYLVGVLLSSMNAY